MVPSERALALQVRLGQALSSLREAVAEPQSFNPATSTRTFVVASNDSVFTILALDVMAEVMRQGNAGLRMAVVPAADAQLVERMAQGEIDLFLGDFTKMPDSLKARHPSNDDFALAQRRGHPRGLQAPSLDEYCGLQHVVVSARADFITPVDHVLSTLGRRRVVVAAVPSYNQVSLLLSQTDGVATLPRRLLRRYQDSVDLLDLPFAMPAFQLAMAWHPRAQAGAGAMWLRECFIRTRQDLDGPP